MSIPCNSDKTQSRQYKEQFVPPFSFCLEKILTYTFGLGGNVQLSLPIPGGDSHLFPSHSEPPHSHHLDSFISSEAAGLKLLADCSPWGIHLLPTGAHPGQAENKNLQLLSFLQRSQGDELPPHKNKLIMAQKR